MLANYSCLNLGMKYPEKWDSGHSAYSEPIWTTLLGKEILRLAL